MSLRIEYGKPNIIFAASSAKKEMFEGGTVFTVETVVYPLVYPFGEYHNNLTPRQVATSYMSALVDSTEETLLSLSFRDLDYLFHLKPQVKAFATLMSEQDGYVSDIRANFTYYSSPLKRNEVARYQLVARGRKDYQRFDLSIGPDLYKVGFFQRLEQVGSVPGRARVMY